MKIVDAKSGELIEGVLSTDIHLEANNKFHEVTVRFYDIDIEWEQHGAV